MRRPLPFFIFVALLVGLDLGSKWAVFYYLQFEERYALIPELLSLTPAKNTGVAFSMFKGSSALWFVLLSSLAIVAFTLIYLRSRKTAPSLVIVALGLLLSGAAGNLYDRVMFEYVRDFIDFVPQIPVIGHWAVFNLADMCITVGVALYFIAEMIRPNSQKEQLAQNVPDPQKGPV